MLYFFVFILLVILGLRHKNHPSLNLYRDLRIVFIVFVLVAGLRYEIGIDYFAYQRAYNNSEGLLELFSSQSQFLKNIFTGWEPGSIIFLALLKTFFDEPQILFFASSLICTILLFRSFKYFCSPQNIFLSFLIYFCFVYMYQEMQALRQALGASIFYCGLIHLSENNTKKAVITTLLAGCFHYSMLLFVPLLFVLKRQISAKFQILCIAFSFVVFVLRIQWMGFIMNYLSSLFSGVGLVMRLIGYGENTDLQRPFYITFILYLLPYIFMLYYSKRKELFKETKLIISQNIYFLFLILTMVFWEFSIISIRYGWICLFGMAIILPHLVSLFKSRIFPLLYIVLFCFLPIKTFMFPDITTLPFTPYENYISVKVFGKKATGRDRAEEVAREIGEVLF